MSLRSFLRGIEEELSRKEEVRTSIQGDMRRVLRLSKEAILLVHQDRFEEAKGSLDEAAGFFARLRGLSEEHPDLVQGGLVDAAFEEYSEARTFLSLVQEKRFISPEELRVPSIPYVLGLGDVVGEFRRRALDSLRRGDVEAAEECLRRMEEIYLELTAMDEAYLLVPGLRRKCDVARGVIEATRGEVTVESRRSSLERSIMRLEEALRGTGKPKKAAG